MTANSCFDLKKTHEKLSPTVVPNSFPSEKEAKRNKNIKKSANKHIKKRLEK
jgi:hypothetical protein